MNQIQKELETCLLEIHAESEQHAQARFRFPATFAGFNGHFPGQPILPGICMIQAVLCLLKSWKMSPVYLQEIVLAKYYRAVTLKDTLEVDCQLTPDDLASGRILAKLTSHDQRVAELKLSVSFS